MAFLLISILFFLIRLVPYWQNNVPLGYDPGLYLYSFKNGGQLSMVLEPGTIFLSQILSRVLSLENLLTPFILFFSCLLLVAVYLLARKITKGSAGPWTALVFACSAIQFRAFWYYYLNNIAALGFLFLTYFFLLGNSYWAIPFSILVAYFHRPTFTFLLVSLAFGFIFNKPQRRFYLAVTIITVAAASLYYLPTFNLTVAPFIGPILKWSIPQALGGSMGEASGTFYEPYQALLLALPYLPFALYGLAKIKQKRDLLIILGPLLLSFVVVLFRLFFFRRVIIFLDIFLIPFAGYGVVLFLEKLKNPGLKKLFTFGYAAFLIVFIGIFIYKTGRPLIFPDEFREIKMLSLETESNAYILVTDEAYIPWVYGWSDRKPITPGFGEYDIYWTKQEWRQFWTSGDRGIEKKLLLKLPKPLYIYDGDHGRQNKYDFSGDCFERINFRTFKFICS